LSVGHPALEASLARRIDRLARAAHAFHRLAHHPLCERYEDEVLRIGRRTRVCRGCAFALLGGVFGAATAVFSGAPFAALASLLLGIGLAGWSLRTPRPPRSTERVGLPRRGFKTGTRFVPAFAVAFALFSAIHSPSKRSLAIGVVASASVLVLVTLYRRRGPNRTPCISCPERLGPTACSGFRPIVRREKAVMRMTGALIRAERCEHLSSHAAHCPPGPEDRSPL
jgi:hypothetical protein